MIHSVWRRRGRRRRRRCNPAAQTRVPRRSLPTVARPISHRRVAARRTCVGGRQKVGRTARIRWLQLAVRCRGCVAG